MRQKYERYIAVGPKNEIKGPIGGSYEFVKQSLIVGCIRASQSPNEIQMTHKEIWTEIKKLGYKIKKCFIVILE